MDDRQFLREFESAAIPSACWTHRAHVRVAFLYLRERPFDEALVRIRSGIQALNRANGILDSATSGYHETLTIAWARIIAAAIEPRDLVLDFETFALANPSLFTKSLLLAHYSREMLVSSIARISFVEPDVAPLPSAHAAKARTSST